MTRRGRKRGNGEVKKGEKEQGIPQVASFDEGFSMWGASRCSFFREVSLLSSKIISETSGARCEIYAGPLRGRPVGSFIRKYYELTR